MFNLDKFISDSVTFRPESMFKADIEANKESTENTEKARLTAGFFYAEKIFDKTEISMK